VQLVALELARVETEQAAGSDKPAPSDEEARIASKLFAQDSEPEQAAACLFWLGAGTATLRDVLRDTFSTATDEEEARRRQRKMERPRE
jgi:hypothetical protein